MRSIKDTFNVVEIPGFGIKLKVGRWYKIIKLNGINTNYIFKFNGEICYNCFGSYYIGRDYSYCLDDGSYYSLETGKFVGDINNIEDIRLADINVVKLFFSDDKI